MSTTYLPDECWEEVFRRLLDNDNDNDNDNENGNDNDNSSLEALSLVSKQLLSITNNLRSSLTLSDQTLRYIPHLFTRFPNLQSLYLRCSTSECDLDSLLHQISQSSLSLHSITIFNDTRTVFPLSGIPAFAKKMSTTLNSLSLINNWVISDANASIYADLLHIIAHSFPFLQQLHLDCSYFFNEHDFDFCCTASDYALKALASALPNLRKVKFCGTHLINDSSLFHLCKNCHFLQELVISNPVLITQPGIAYAIKEAPNLTLFSVTNMYTPDPPVLDLFISSFANAITNLTCLDLSGWEISDELLVSIAMAGIPLRKLELQECDGYSYAGISCLLSKCPLIQHLNLEYAEFLEDEHISCLSVFSVNLIFINLGGCSKLTDLSLLALIKNCPLLKEIIMYRTTIGENGGTLLDSSMPSFVNPSIRSLDLSQNESLRDESIILFASICPNLEVLTLHSFNGNDIVEVLKRCPRIRHLNLSLHSKTGLLSGMMNFQFPKLEVLKLSGSEIDDESLFIISATCHGLRLLEVRKCPWITTKGVKQVVESCKQLKEINLTSCNQVDADIVAWMVVSSSSLRRIFAPPGLSLGESQRELFLSHGCRVS